MGPKHYSFDDQLVGIAEMALIAGAADKDCEDVFSSIQTTAEFEQTPDLEVDPMRLMAMTDLLLRKITQGNTELHRSLLGGLSAILESRQGKVLTAVGH